ncbi:hypothetical protein GRL63_005026 [Salmonella enterica]|nr:hypothetical protein [Salmonella enterica]EDY7501851.1 hypothetical protein [Salmonella enterica]
MGRWWRYKWITFHPSLTVYAGSRNCDCHHTFHLKNTHRCGPGRSC